jgi:DNA-directed RNA polymerase subunit M/transcription elongation factor TFIIS
MLTRAHADVEEKPRSEKSVTCKACGGRLILMVEIPAHGQPNEQDHPRTRYFTCERCAQIQVLEE